MFTTAGVTRSSSGASVSTPRSGSNDISCASSGDGATSDEEAERRRLQPGPAPPAHPARHQPDHVPPRPLLARSSRPSMWRTAWAGAQRRAGLCGLRQGTPQRIGRGCRAHAARRCRWSCRSAPAPGDWHRAGHPAPSPARPVDDHDQEDGDLLRCRPWTAQAASRSAARSGWVPPAQGSIRKRSSGSSADCMTRKASNGPLGAAQDEAGSARKSGQATGKGDHRRRLPAAMLSIGGVRSRRAAGLRSKGHDDLQRCALLPGMPRVPGPVRLQG